jgi:hypothetical protein
MAGVRQVVALAPQRSGVNLEPRSGIELPAPTRGVQRYVPF